MTTDPDRFPIPRVREYVNYLHEHNQHYIVMVDPAMAFQTERENGLPYDTFLRGQEQGVLLQKNGTTYQGVVWPGGGLLFNSNNHVSIQQSSRRMAHLFSFYRFH